MQLTWQTDLTEIGIVRELAGHSLGGALAELAAFDIQRALRAANKDCFMSCYTLGAPRLGNHAFAHLFRATVPDCWSLINDQVCL